MIRQAPSCSRAPHGFRSRLVGLRRELCTGTIATEFHASTFCSGECGRRAIGYCLGLVLRGGRENVGGKAISLREINGLKLDAGFHQGRYERDVAGEPIEFGDNQFGTMDAARGESIGKLWSIFPLAALYLCELGDNAPVAAVEIVAYDVLLGFEPEAASTLPQCRDTVVGDEIAGLRCHGGLLPCVT
jgi:hypothetical protein